jgi:hypothetical protein
MRNRLLISLLLIVPLSLFAESIDPQAALTQVNLLVAQYEARIKQLEAENSVLRYEMVKAGIKIPLTDYSGAIIGNLPTTLTGVVSKTGSTLTLS